MSIIDNKRIAKNALYLYFRQIFSILVNFYTVRVVWQVLGIDNYGIYQVVAGVVLMFQFINNAMVASSQRFISFELGRGGGDRLQRAFSISVIVHFIIGGIIVLLAETVGLWFLNSHLNIPAERMSAANWVFQCSVLSFFISVISVPYNSCIVAHEHLNIYGIYGVIEVLLKLGIVFLLMTLPGDKLVVYAILVLSVSVVMRILYGRYCLKHFSECRFRFAKDGALIKNMFSFAGWSFLGNMGFSGRDYGQTIVLNMFFNVAVNAAKGVASSIGGVVNSFSHNFTMSVNPQITKRYAAEEYESMITLVHHGCRFASLLLMIIAVPVIVAAPQILRLWLGEIAPYTISFLRWTLVMATIDSYVSPITCALQATGRIRNFQIIVCLIMLLTLPVSIALLEFWSNPILVMYVCCASSVVALMARILLLHREISFSLRKFVRQVFGPTVLVFALSMSAQWPVYSLFPNNIWGLIGFGFTSITISLTLTYIIGLRQNERAIAIKTIRSKLHIK